MNTITHSPRFVRAMSALITAYLKGHIGKGSFCQCAIGNMIAHACDYKADNELMWETKHGKFIKPSWFMAFYTDYNGRQKLDTIYLSHPVVRDELRSTGYSVGELMKIEYAFERATEIVVAQYKKYTTKEIDEDQLNGLRAVVQVLCEIEGIEDSAPFVSAFDKSRSLEEALAL